MSALTGFRVIELAEGVTGEYCGKLLSDFGAEIIKIERPDKGSPTRAMAPIVAPGVEGSGLFAYLNTNKKSITLDLGSAADVEILHSLIASAEAVIDDHDDEWLRTIGITPEIAEKSYPGVVFCAVSNFGPNAPHGWRNAKTLNVFHASGWAYHTPTSPDPTRPPLKGAGRFMLEYDSGLEAAICVTGALYAQGRGRGGEYIDISKQEVMVSRADAVLGRQLAGDDPANNSRANYDQRGPSAFHNCRDGSVYLYFVSQAHWAAWKVLLDNPEWMKRFADNWLEFGVTEELVAICKAECSKWLADQDRDDVCERAQRLGIPLVQVNNASDLIRSEQFQHRNFFQRLEHPVIGSALYPTVPYLLSVSPSALVTPAPALGQHNGAISPQKAAARPASRPAELVTKPGPLGARGGPLAGVRVLELTKVWAGPYAGKLLSFLGAEVIKVESMNNLDEMRAYGGVDINSAPWFQTINPEIMSVQLNLKSAEGMDYLRQMIAKSDIVINNIRPGAMERMGMDYASMRAIKKDIIAVSLKMYGNEGPLGYQTGYAPCFTALAGLCYPVGYEGEGPRGVSMRYGDSTSGAGAVMGALLALMHREQTGEGQFVDVSAVEIMSTLVGDGLFEHNLTGRIPAPDGNRHSEMAPHGAYPCMDAEWISIAVETADEWARLCDALGLAALKDDPRFATMTARQENLPALDELVGQATVHHHAAALAARLREAGVPAAKAQNSLDMISDDHLWSRGIFRVVTDSLGRSRPIIGPSWHFARSPVSIQHGSPMLGEHNDYVYGDVLGVSAEKLGELISSGVVH